MTEHARPDPEDLLQHAEWMRAMAIRLVGDPWQADDVVQGAWAAAVEAPPKSRQALGGWLKSVVRNLSWQSHRQDSRRRRREALVARPEAEASSAEGVVARAELQRVIVEAVLSLDEPYRSTVILRFFEQQTPAEIAARDGVPVKTVWTRLSRALERLRSRLDQEHGGREPWCAILLPLITAPALVAGSGATAASASSSSAVATTGVAPTLLTTTTTGSAIIMSKVIAGVTIVGAVAVGAVVGHFTAGDSSPPGLPEDMLLVDQAAYRALQEEGNQLRAKLDSVLAERDAERSRAEQLASETSALQEQIDANEAAREALAESRSESAVAVAFGKYAELEGVKNAEWDEMAAAVAIMSDTFLELIALENEGKDPPPGSMQDIRRENNKLVKYLGGVATHIDTHAPVNGEYTHPITLTNVLGAMLDREELPLSEEQLRRIVAHGESFDAEYDRLQGSYDEQTTTQRKVLDELVLKRTVMGRVEDELTRDQRDAVIKPSLHDRLQVDPRSPVQMLAMSVQDFQYDSREELRAALPSVISKLCQVPAESLGDFDSIFDRYMEAVDSLLRPIPKEELIKFFTIDDAIIAGQAFHEMTTAIRDHPSASASVRQRVQEDPRWFVPRIRAPE